MSYGNADAMAEALFPPSLLLILSPLLIGEALTDAPAPVVPPVIMTLGMILEVAEAVPPFSPPMPLPLSPIVIAEALTEAPRPPMPPGVSMMPGRMAEVVAPNAPLPMPPGIPALFEATQGPVLILTVEIDTAWD